LTDLEDGWDLYRSDAIVIQNSYISNDDDGVSFKPIALTLLCKISSVLDPMEYLWVLLANILGRPILQASITLFSLVEKTID
jgi:hypothetical protein